MLGKLAREDEADRGLDLPRRDGRALVVLRKLGGLDGDTLKDVVDERVQDRHGLVRDTSVGVDLLEHLVNWRRGKRRAGVRKLSGGLRRVEADAHCRCCRSHA